MSFWNPRSISGKLTRMNLMVSGMALLLAYMSFLFYDLYSLRQNLVHSLETEAAIVGSNSISALVFDDPQAAESTLGGLRGSPHIRAAEILNSDGKVFARYSRDSRSDARIEPRLLSDQNTGTWDVAGGLVLGRSILFGQRTMGSVYLLADTSELTHRAKQFGILSALILLLCLLVALGASLLVRRLVSEPLTDLAQTAQIVSQRRDYSVRATPPRSGDELAFLVESFNAMLEQIQQRDHALEESRSALEKRVGERTAELTAANQELEAFSYSVAHDLRGPLQQITNLLFLLQGTCTDKDGEGLIEQLFQSCGRMSRLIEDLLNLSRATSTPLRRTPINLSEMAAAILKTLQTEAPDRAVQVVVAPGAHVIADEGLTLVALENLLRNAWKYSSRREGSRIEFGYKEEPSSTVYFVRDNGVGFNPQYADRLFRPFQRLHSTSDFPGTGIGLATVQRIIARHGGRIWATGHVDQGAQFSFTLPYESGH